MLLSLNGLSKSFGGIKAVNNLSFQIPHGGVYSIIGPNGAGKSTVFNLISGIYKPTYGEISFKGQSIQKLKSHKITKLGISRTFQNIRLFQNVSVWDNIAIAQTMNFPVKLLPILFHSQSYRDNEKAIHSKVSELVHFVGLENSQGILASNLSYGEQRRLEIARALACEPELILLDEPAAGMNDTETEQLIRLIDKIKQKQITILLIEHDMSLVMAISDEIFVMNFGSKIAQGNSLEIRNHPEVIKAYLGSGE